MSDTKRLFTRRELFLQKIADNSVQAPEPSTREELYLAKIAGMDVTIPEPCTRAEMYLAAAAGADVVLPAPTTREEMFLAKLAGMDIATPEPDSSIEALLSGAAGGGGGNDDTPTEWAAVFTSIKAGTYATDYAIGDTVPLDLGAEGIINMQIAAFDTDDLADGSGKAPITWISKELLATSKRMNPGRVDLYDYKEQAATTNTNNNSSVSANSSKTIKFRQYIQAGEVAEITNTINVTADGTLTITYKGAVTRDGKLEVVVNGETIVSDYDSTTTVDHTVEVASGDVVTVVARYTSVISDSTSASVAFKSTGTFTITTSCNNVVSRYQSGYKEGTGSVGGWEKSEARAYYQNTLRALIPDSVASAIKAVSKTHTANDTAGTPFTQTTTDEVWMPDINEVDFNSGPYKGLFTNSGIRAKYKVGDGTPSTWWLRSAGVSKEFKFVEQSGIGNSGGANKYYSLALCFCT